MSIVCTSFPPPRTSPSQAGVFKGRQETSWKRMLMKARRSVDTALPCVKRRHTSRHVIIRNRARNFTHKCSIWQRPTLRKLGPTTDHWHHACYFVRLSILCKGIYSDLDYLVLWALSVPSRGATGAGALLLMSLPSHRPFVYC